VGHFNTSRAFRESLPFFAEAPSEAEGDAERWPAEPPTPLASVLRRHIPPIHHIQPVSTITDIPLAMPENEDLIGPGRIASVSRDRLSMPHKSHRQRSLKIQMVPKQPPLSPDSGTKTKYFAAKSLFRNILHISPLNPKI
jgi:hypothetical protein